MDTIIGKRAVLEALKARLPIDRLVVAHADRDRADLRPILYEARMQKVHVQFASAETFQGQFPEESAQGIGAVLNPKNKVELSVLTAHPDQYPLVVMLDHLQDPHNFGAILRTCEAFGVNAVVFPKDRGCQLTPAVTKIASGAAHLVPLVKVTNLAQSVQALKDAGYWIYGASSQGGDSLESLTIHTPCVLILGNEEKGISPLLTRSLDAAVHIPLAGQIGSLNVSVAAGIFIYRVSSRKSRS